MSTMAQIKENIKAPRHWPLCGEFTGTGEFPAQRASNAKMFPFDNVIMDPSDIGKIDQCQSITTRNKTRTSFIILGMYFTGHD